VTRRCSLAIVAVCLGSMAVTAAVWAQQTCLPGCDPTQPSDSCCPLCLTDACAKLEQCIGRKDDAFEKCVSHVPPIGGHCAFTRDLLKKCRGAHDTGLHGCQSGLRPRINRKCRLALGFRCRISNREGRQACARCGAAVTSDFLTSDFSDGRTLSAPSAAEPELLDCQARCIQDVVASCYGECADRCEGDGLALTICEQGCRNDACSTLERACTDTPGPSAARYRSCCQGAGDCTDAVDCKVPPTSTTTVQTTTTTTTTTP